MTTSALAVARSTETPLTPSAVRQRADMTTADMADLMGMSEYGYKQWESGQRRPGGPAWRLLHLIDVASERTIADLRSFKS